MFVDIPQNLLLLVAGAFLLGWLLSTIASAMSARSKAHKRDPRDDRIRELEASVRIAKTDAEKAHAKIEKLEAENAALRRKVERQDEWIVYLMKEIVRWCEDAKDNHVVSTGDLIDAVSEVRKQQTALEDTDG